MAAQYWRKRWQRSHPITSVCNCDSFRTLCSGSRGSALGTAVPALAEIIAALATEAALLAAMLSPPSRAARCGSEGGDDNEGPEGDPPDVPGREEEGDGE